MKIKKGDTVQVLSGKDRGLRGKVIVAYPDSDRVIVEGERPVDHAAGDDAEFEVVVAGIASESGQRVGHVQAERLAHHPGGLFDDVTGIEILL